MKHCKHPKELLKPISNSGKSKCTGCGKVVGELNADWTIGDYPLEAAADLACKELRRKGWR